MTLCLHSLNSSSLAGGGHVGLADREAGHPHEDASRLQSLQRVGHLGLPRPLPALVGLGLGPVAKFNKKILA